MTIRKSWGLSAVLLVSGLGTLGVSADETKSPRKEGYIRPEINGPVLDPEEAISKMHVADGYRLNLFAAEPHVETRW